MRRSCYAGVGEHGGFGRQVFVSRWWPVEVTTFASALNASAVIFPIMTVLATSWTGRVVAGLCLIPTIGGRGPAAAFVRRAWKCYATPIVVFHDTVGWLEAKSLFGLRRTNIKCTLRRAASVCRRSELREGQFHWCLPDVECHGGIGHVDITWDGHCVLWGSVAGRCNEYLGAGDIELRIGRRLVCLMQSQKFGADKIVAWCEILGDVDREMAIVGNELLSAPLAGGAVIVLLENFEPTVADSLVGNGIVDFLHVH